MISIIIPVYNRPMELDELLESLAAQTAGDFEVVVVEDGSRVPAQEIVEKYRSQLAITYCVKENGGPGPARNCGAQQAHGNFFIFLDSDTIMPPNYVAVVEHAVAAGVRAFGGPDKADENFTAMQRAVSYSMTSFFTTGGIRGRRRGLDRFVPRSFNMGVARDVFEETGGFLNMRFGEDIDLSMRIMHMGVNPVLLPDAAVYHKRRTNLKSFFRQVFHSGTARINLTKRHPGSLKAVHLFPALFLLGSAACLVLAIWRWAFLLPFGVVALVWFTDAAIRNRSARVGALAVAASFMQLCGYGAGFLYGIWLRIIRGRSEEETYRTKFF